LFIGSTSKKAGFTDVMMELINFKTI